MIDPRFDIHEATDESQNEIRNETGSSIYDDTSTIAGSVLYAGGSDSSTIAGDGQTLVSEGHSGEVMNVQEILKHLDDVIKQHYDQGGESLDSGSVTNSASTSHHENQEGGGPTYDVCRGNNNSGAKSKDNRDDVVRFSIITHSNGLNIIYGE